MIPCILPSHILANKITLEGTDFDGFIEHSIKKRVVHPLLRIIFFFSVKKKNLLNQICSKI